MPFGIPGIGDEIEGAIQQAPQPLRQSMLDPSIYNQMKDNRICPKQNPDLKCGRHHEQVCSQTFRKQKGQHSASTIRATCHRVFSLNAELKRANSITFFAPAKVTIPLA
ncbi:hypothetical protein OD218_002597 [Salmonella enterica]|uniref:hypothetical protein n=1 Tax=Salmonella enterica TaxID=28901 RepID=UPI001495EB5C|nr:hypothetical protein [Salmonella enterica]HAU3136001.1 hypothetical protein [Salmonella enterica subsp. diarizonae]HCA3616896.1 hypothetical protein [Salmonella enterica subsp. diarizonae serovar 61:i:z]EEN6470233.1 hypothetical protein [Salmonella enterica subsp. enterica]EEU4805358.1 hypothetical protein [Salmonella enterica]EEU4868886.1 hypothetical protein [Salmonella enterica]